jgi:small subunit ribosomal protein S4
MKRQKKKYERPKKPWDKARIEEEKKLLEKYGLRRKREIWRAESILRNYRRIARELAARRDKEREKILIDKLFKMGILKKKEATLDDVLALTVEDILERRLQTIVHKKGLAKTLKQARQFIVHGHIAVDGRRVRWPSMLVPVSEEDKIGFYEKSSLNK